jgi:hypothetical protein
MDFSTREGGMPPVKPGAAATDEEQALLEKYWQAGKVMSLAQLRADVSVHDFLYPRGAVEGVFGGVYSSPPPEQSVLDAAQRMLWH